MRWVEVYKYDLGFCVLYVMIHAQPNGINSDDKYTMVVYKMTKTRIVYRKAN
jgi:hypothetical protein